MGILLILAGEAVNINAESRAPGAAIKRDRLQGKMKGQRKGITVKGLVCSAGVNLLVQEQGWLIAEGGKEIVQEAQNAPVP